MASTRGHIFRLLPMICDTAGERQGTSVVPKQHGVVDGKLNLELRSLCSCSSSATSWYCDRGTVRNP